MYTRQLRLLEKMPLQETFVTFVSQTLFNVRQFVHLHPSILGLLGFRIATCPTVLGDIQLALVKLVGHPLGHSSDMLGLVDLDDKLNPF